MSIVVCPLDLVGGLIGPIQVGRAGNEEEGHLGSPSVEGWEGQKLPLPGWVLPLRGK